MILLSTMSHAGGALIQPATGPRFQAMAMGYDHSAMINASGQLYTSGNQNYGKCGNGVSTNTVAWTKQFVTLPAAAIQVSVSRYGTSVLLNDNTVRFFGGGSFNNVRGDGSTSDTATPIEPNNNDNAACVALGRYGHLILKKTGALYGCGAVQSSGHGAAQTTMAEIPALSGEVITQMSVGDNCTAAIDLAGNLWTWGSNGSGQLGRPSDSTIYTPTKVSGMTGCLKVSCGLSNIHVLKTDGTVWTAGKSANGANGNGTTTPDLSTFTQIATISGATDISCGHYHGMAVTGTGIVAWGQGTSGQLCDGSTVERTTPVSTIGLTGTAEYVSCGAGQNFAANTAGGIYAGGFGNNGQFATTTSPGTLTNFANAAYTSETVLTP